MIKKVSFVILLIFLFPSLNQIFSQELDMASATAAEEFQWGVRSFHSTLFNEAIRSFEAALGHKPEDPLIMYWLGLSYLRSGMEETALSLWNRIMERGRGSSFINARIEKLSWRRSVSRGLLPQSRYLITYSHFGTETAKPLFTRPAGVASGRNGEYYLTSYATNEVLLFSANAGLRSRIPGGLEGYNRPFDLLAIPERDLLFVAEYGGNRITRSTLSGGNIIRFGTRGRSPGQLLGPQFLAEDGKGYIYVTEVGNRRVTKYDLDGNYILHFGTQAGVFRGFLEPTGVVCLKGYVFVSDARAQEILVFDESGNFLKSLGKGLLNKPEGLSRFDEDSFLVADTTRLLLYSLSKDTFTLFSDLGGQAKRVVKAIPYNNGFILAADFDSDALYFLSELRGVYSNMNLQINRIVADDFPKVQIDLTVEDSSGNPVLGLEAGNFLISEGRRDVGDITLNYVGNIDETLSLAFLLERSEEIKPYKEEIVKPVSTLVRLIPPRSNLRVVGASSLPVIEVPVSVPFGQYTSRILANSDFSATWQFDSGVRLAASELLPLGSKRAVIFITSGLCPAGAFDRYKLVEIAQYLRSNQIQFYCISVGPANREIAAEYRYLAETTGGGYHHLYQPEGIAGILEEIKTREHGRYIFSYTSVNNSQFGRAYIPVEVEINHFNRSGRDELGYFAPLTF